MHTLPFGARLTDALVDILRDAAAKCLPEHPDFLPSLGWHTSFPDGVAFEHWGISAFSRSYLQPIHIFIVDGVTFSMSELDQARAAGCILDWKTGVGIVQMDVPKEI
jgi:hypothetical protein